MYIIEVIPIARAIGVEILSYFSPVELPLGGLVQVPLRSRRVSGIVSSVRLAQDMKSDLKRADFALKKIYTDKSSAKKVPQIFSKEFMETMRLAADYYATTIGGVLAAFVPDFIFKKASELTFPTQKEVAEYVSPSSSKNDGNGGKRLHEVHVIQGDDDERFVSYRALIRQEFAKKSSVFMCAPTIEDAIHTYENIGKGIEDYVFLLHSSLPLKKNLETWEKIMKEKHPVVIVATGGFMCIPRLDIGALILEKESGRGWKSQRRPYLDIRRVAEMYAVKKMIPLTLGDTLLTTETLWRESEGEIIAGSPFKFRSLSPAKETIVDMKQYKTANGQFRILSDETEALILANKESNGHMIIFALRRGSSPSVVCADCQTIVTCNECSTPVVLHEAPGERPAVGSYGVRSFFMCHRCGARRPSEEYCKTCQSWKLATVGIGIDLVAQKIREKFPTVHLVQIDADTIKNEKLARAAVADFRNHPGSVLLGTEMMLLYLTGKVDNASVISLDSLFSIPDFRIHEKILHTLVKIRSLTQKEFIVQTRKADEKIFNYALTGNLIEFHRTALEERKTWNYPPFTTLIKITIEGEKTAISTEMADLQKKFLPFELDIFPAFTHTVKGNYVLHGLLRLPREKWPHADLRVILRALPPYITVNVDPDSLL